MLDEAGGKYGDNIIDKYSKKLVIEVGKKYNRRTLFRMKQFYNVFNNEKVSTLSTQLSWSHYTELLSIKDENEIIYYLNLCINQHIDVLLYNIKYRCYVVIELKVSELRKEHTGHIMTYMNYINKNIKTAEDNATVGIIICKQDNEYVIKYCSDDRIIARTYELYSHETS